MGDDLARVLSRSVCHVRSSNDDGRAIQGVEHSPERGPGPLGRCVGRARRSVSFSRRRFRQRARDDKPSATEIGGQREQVYGACKKAVKRRKHIVHLRRRRDLSREMKHKVRTYLMKEALEISQVQEIALPPTRSRHVFLDWMPRNGMNLGSFGQQSVEENVPGTRWWQSDLLDLGNLKSLLH